MANLTQVATHAGHTVALKIGGYLVGRAQTANARRTFGTQGIYEIGSIMPVEHIPLRYEGSVTMDKFLIRLGAQFASLRGILKDIIGASAYAVTDEDLILNTGILNIAVHRTKVTNIGTQERFVAGTTLSEQQALQAINRTSVEIGPVIRAYLGCTLSDYTESFRANAVAGENATFFFLDCIDSVESVSNQVAQQFSSGSVSAV